LLLGVALSLAFWARPNTKKACHIPERPREFIARQFELCLGEHGDLDDEAE